MKHNKKYKQQTRTLLIITKIRSLTHIEFVVDDGDDRWIKLYTFCKKIVFEHTMNWNPSVVKDGDEHGWIKLYIYIFLTTSYVWNPYN